MAVVHTVSQAFIVKEDYESVIDAWRETPEARFLYLNKLIKIETEGRPAEYAKITIDCDMIVAVQE